jgi:hypothetical protein
MTALRTVYLDDRCLRLPKGTYTNQKLEGTAAKTVKAIGCVLLDGDVAVATNGHFLTMFPLPDTPDRQRQIVDPPLLLRFPPKMPKVYAGDLPLALAINRKKGVFYARSDNVELEGALENPEDYAEYEPVLNKPWFREKAYLSARYLADIRHILGEDVFTLEFEAAEIGGFNPTGACRITAGDGMAIIMPAPPEDVKERWS